MEERIGNSLVVREPIGVVGCITPWNYPLHQIVNKVAPALAAGCTVVLKPSEIAPLDAFILAEVIDEVGLPAGVFNLVTGFGPVVGEAIAAHPDVDMVVFTGSTRAGKRVSVLASETVKRVALELGGKSANIILDDADLADGRAHGRVRLLPELGPDLHGPHPHARAAGQAGRGRRHRRGHGGGLPRRTGRPGRRHARPARRRPPSATGSSGYIRKGIDEGATLVTGGPEAPEGLDTGYFVRPTVFGNVSSDMTIAQEEIFGPVLSIIPYEDEEDAIRIANDTPYGLAGGVRSADEERAQRVARRMRTGQVDVNGGSFNIKAPFGGYKQSGRRS